MAVRLMLVDDHPVVRQGLRSFLSTQHDLQVVAESGDLAGARELIRKVAPDMVLLDLILADGNGLDLIREYEGRPKPKWLVLTSFLDEEYIRASLRAGACGYLLKHAGTASLLDGIKSALRGEIPLDPQAVALLAMPAEDSLASLTVREREVLALLAGGMTNKAIANTLGVTEKTVKSHLGRVFAKLDVRDRTQAALLAREHGLRPKSQSH